MNIDKYNTFLVCVQSRTFYDAADVLCLTASTVSKHVSALEQELGVTLFERTPKGLILTAEGVRRLPFIRQLVDAHDRLMMISDGVIIKEGLNICSAPVFARFHLNQMMEEYSTAHPTLPAKIIERLHTRKLLEKREFELAFLRGLTSDLDAFDRIEFKIGDMGLVVANANPLARECSISLHNVRNVALVGPDTSIYRTLYAELFADMGYLPDITYLLPREDAVLIDVRDHNSIGLLSSDVYDVYQLQGTAFVPFNDAPPSIGVLVRLHNVPLSAPSKAFWDFAEKWLVKNRNATLLYNHC